MSDLPNGWVETTLGELVAIKYGKDHKHLADGDYPLYGSGGVMRHVEKPLYSKESILIPRKGTLSNLFYVNEAFWSVDTIFYTEIDKQKAIPLFLFYKLKTIDLVGLNVGSAVPSLTTKVLNPLELCVPSLPEQKAIADILSSFDEKIELLREQNKTLETLAQTIFKEWFVNFNYPNATGDYAKRNTTEGSPLAGEEHATNEMVDSELGEIPKDWRVGYIGDLFELHRGFDLPKKDRKEGIYPVYAAGGYHGQHANYKMEPPGIITGRSGVIGKVYLSLTKYWPLNTTLYVRNFKACGPYYTYFFLKMFDLEAINSGSAVPSLNRNNVHNIPTLIADANLLERFENITKEIFGKIKFNDSQVETLSKTRDTLLPKLMSGQVRVGEAAS